MILLDTHALIWWVNGEKSRLSENAARAIDEHVASGSILVSAMSAWEIAMLVERGRIALSIDIETWLATVGEIPGVRFVAVDNSIAIKGVTLPGEFHKDPADRMIVATAREMGVAIVTADEKIHSYPHVRVLW